MGWHYFVLLSFLPPSSVAYTLLSTSYYCEFAVALLLMPDDSEPAPVGGLRGGNQKPGPLFKSVFVFPRKERKTAFLDNGFLIFDFYNGLHLKFSLIRNSHFPTVFLLHHSCLNVWFCHDMYLSLHHMSVGSGQETDSEHITQSFTFSKKNSTYKCFFFLLILVKSL